MVEKRLPSSLVHSYGFATMAFSLMMLVATYYYTYFMTDVALFKPSHLTIYMLLTHLVDAASPLSCPCTPCP